MESSSPVPELSKPSAKALGKRKAATPSSDEDEPLSKRAAAHPSSTSSYDATQLIAQPNNQVTAVPSSSPAKSAIPRVKAQSKQDSAPPIDSSDDDDDEIQIIRSPKRRAIVDLGDDDDDEEEEKEEKKVKENDQGEMTLAPFYSTTCPICLGQPSPLVVTKCGHTLYVLLISLFILP